MANISDLAHRADRQQPEWIAALATSEGFIARERPVLSSQDTRIAEEKGESEAIAQAYRKGRAEGAEEAEQRFKMERQAQDDLKLAFARLDQAASSALRQHLAETVAELCAQVIEPHLIDHASISARCETLLESIGEAPVQCVLHLHPDDIGFVDKQLATTLAIRKDATLARGTLRLEGREGLVRDGPEDWRRAFREALQP